MLAPRALRNVIFQYIKILSFLALSYKLLKGRAKFYYSPSSEFPEE